MPSPSTSLATLRPELGATLEEFDLGMNSRGFIAQRVLPVFEAGARSGSFGRIPIEQLLQSPETRRAPGSGFNRGTFTFLPETYATKENGWEEPIDDTEKEAYADYFDLEVVTTARAYEFVLGGMERRVSALLYNATTYASQKTTITHEWDDPANATPIADVETAAKAIYGRTGLWPNAMVLNKKQFRALRNCSEIIDRLKYQGFHDAVDKGSVNEQMLAALFDLGEVIVADSSKNTASEGQDAAIAPNWSDEYAGLFRKTMTRDLKEPGLGRTFHWDAAGSQVNGAIETYRDETVASDIVRVRNQTDEKVIYSECWQLFENVITI